MRNWISKIWQDDRQLTPGRAVLHPAFILAVAVLLINDHVLKPAAFAELFTGKLSDFAGLFFAPVLLAAILGVKRRRGLVLSGLAMGGVFAAINLSPALAGLWDAAISTITPFHTTPDPTDLVALIAIPVGLALFEPEMHDNRAGNTRRLVEYAAVTVAGLASMATSPEPCTQENGCWEPARETSEVSLLNKTHELHALRVRSLRDSVRVDCDEVERSPNDFLRDAAFGPPETWFVQSGQEIPLRPVTFDEWGQAIPQQGGACSVVLVQSDTVPDILVFWGDGLETKSFQFDAAVPKEIPADPNTVVLDADYSRTPGDQMHPWRNRGECGERADLCGEALLEPLATIPDGARYSWRSQAEGRLHYVRPTIAEGTLERPDEQCRMPEPGDGLAWEQPPSGDYLVVGMEPGIDGCHELKLRRSTQLDGEEPPRGWWLCVPFDALEFLTPTETTYTRVAISRQDVSSSFSNGGYEGLRIDASTVPRDPEQMSGSAERKKIYVVNGYGVPRDVDFGFDVAVGEGCKPVEVSCGQTAMPVDVLLSDYGERVAPGDSITVGEVAPLEVHVARAEYRPVLDTTCEAEEGAGEQRLPTDPSVAPAYIEAVIIAGE